MECWPGVFNSSFRKYSKGNSCIYGITAGVPNPGPWPATCPRPVRKRPAQQEVSGRGGSKALFVFTAAFHHLHYCLSSASGQISSRIRFT